MKPGSLQRRSRNRDRDSDSNREPGRDRQPGSYSRSLHLFRGIVREWVLVTVILLPFTAALSLGSLVTFDNLIYDRLLPHLPVPVDPRLLVVEIDDRSVAALGRWPWPRDTHARLLEQLAGEGKPAAVLFDLIFTEPDVDPAVDERLGAAICNLGNVMLPLLRHSETVGEVLPVDPVARCARHVGHINVQIDFDGVMRDVYLREGPPDEPRPQLAWLLYQQLMADNHGQAVMPGDPGEAEAGWHRDHAIRIPFASRYPTVSYINVLRGEVPARLLHNRVVLIGATASGLGDRYVTPISRRAGLTSGVVVQADILNSLLGQHSIVPLPPGVTAALATVPVVLLLLSLLLTGLRHTSWLTLLAVVFTLTLCWVLLRLGWWWPPTASLLSLLLANLLWSWRRLSAVLAYFAWELARLDVEPKVLPEHRRLPPARLGDRLQQRVMALERAVGRMRDTHRFMSDGLQHMPVATLVCGIDERILMANLQARRLVNQELVGSNLGSCLAALGYPQREGDQRRIEAHDGVEFRTSDGRSLRLGVASLLAGEGVIEACLLVSLVDLTAERDMETQRSNLVRFLSHDLRAPHGAILSLLDVAERESGGNDAQGEIKYQVNRALRLIDDFTQLSRAESAAFQLKPMLFAAIALDACDQVWALAQAKDIRVERRFVDDDIMVLADQALLCRALFNLLENAIKYSPEGSRVELRLTREEGWAVCTVSDQGDGIASEDMPHLFDLYRRLSSSRTSDGLGLGLPMVGMVADCHGGRVECHSESGRGSSFSLFLPVLCDDADPEGPA